MGGPWHWAFYKLSNFSSFEVAQDYMRRKPVPYVGGALNLSSWSA